MQFISMTDTQQTVASLIDKVKGEALFIREQDRDVAVVLSIEEYQRITRTNIENFQQFRKDIGGKAQERGLTEDKLSELLSDY